MNDLPSLGFVWAIKSQNFIRHAETIAALYSDSLAYSMAFTPNSSLFILF
jgi:hypothetical protein